PALAPPLPGDARLSLLPRIYLRFRAARRGAAGAPPPPTLTAERLTAGLRVLPLLLGRVEIADVTLEAPAIRIDLASDGRTNWSPLIAKLVPGKKPARLAAFSEIRITRGTITVSDRARNLAETLTDVELSLAWPSISKSFGATGRVTWRGEPLDISATLGDFASALIGTRSSLKMRISGKPIKAAFDGAFSALPTLKLEGTLAADGASLRKVIAWSGQREPPGGGFGHFALKAQTNIVGGTAALTGVNVELDGNVAEGVLTLSTDQRHTLQGTLAADKIDLTPYLASVKLLAGNRREWDAERIDISGLTGLDVDLRLSAGKVVLTSTTLDRTALAANLRSGHLIVTIGESQGFGGTITGTFTIASAATGTDVKTQLQLQSVNLDSCLTELIGFKRLEGTGNITLALEGSGASVLDITRTLNGAATLTARRGAITGLNVEQLLRRLERRPLSGGGDFRSGQTPYERLAMQLKIVDGTIHVEDVDIAGSAVKLALAGTASIPEREFDLKGTAALVNAAGTAAFELPFVMQGSWADPLLLPDPRSLIRRSGAAAPLLDAVRSRNDGAIRSAIERLTGTQRPTAAAPGVAPVSAPAN
ncbi:MAG: AsmA family protein, partial [Pseudolabrys sp.]